MKLDLFSKNTEKVNDLYEEIGGQANLLNSYICNRGIFPVRIVVINSR